ncbi:DUF6907 domain-containing protein [Streptomyces sp. NPDC002467]|uniref:DUF6907 domain-containing protein n=1 Tax=Streptomyces sp. NPDC002467 TaxID=3364647 RepID=UPI0036977D6D
MKTYTCPAWCTVDHGDDPPVDVFHRGARIRIVPPADLTAPDEQAIVPQMTAHLVVYEVPSGPEETAVVMLELDDHPGGRATEMQLADVDDVLAQLDTYQAQLAQMRATMAAILEAS